MFYESRKQNLLRLFDLLDHEICDLAHSFVSFFISLKRWGILSSSEYSLVMTMKAFSVCMVFFDHWFLNGKEICPIRSRCRLNVTLDVVFSLVGRESRSRGLLIHLPFYRIIKLLRRLLRIE